MNADASYLPKTIACGECGIEICLEDAREVPSFITAKGSVFVRMVCKRCESGERREGGCPRADGTAGSNERAKGGTMLRRSW